jgi:uncharacterized membrane protein
MSRMSRDVNWVLVATVAAATFALVGVPDPIRLLPGLAATLLLPGYALSIALFPDAEFDAAERVALAFGLSLGLIIVFAILISWARWPVPAAPILVLAVATAVFCLVAEWRRRPADSGPSAAAASRGHRPAPQTLSGVLPIPAVDLLALLALAGAAIAFAYTAIAPSPVTEFYAVGSEGFTEDYPRQVVPGRTSTLNIGIVNGEGTTTYRVAVIVGSKTAGTIGPISLEDQEEWRGSVQFAVSTEGVGQELTAVLYKGGSLEPYRSLRFWVDALPSP